MEHTRRGCRGRTWTPGPQYPAGFSGGARPAGGEVTEPGGEPVIYQSQDGETWTVSPMTALPSQ